MKPLAVLSLTIALFGALAWQVARTLDAPPDPFEAKVAAAKRFLYYVVEPDSGPDFPLTGKERVLHLMSHAVVPPLAYDPARQVVYGFRLTLLSGGKETWRHDVYTRSRQSKSGVADGRWLAENAFALDSHLQVSDDRTIIVRFPFAVAAGSRLRVRLLGEPREALVRLYSVEPRPRANLALSSLSPADREALTVELSFTPWDRLDADERLARLKTRELRVSAEGEGGPDYRTRTLYYTGFRLPGAESVAAPPLLVTPARGMAVNVVGPGSVLVTLSRAAAGDAAAGLTIRSLGEGQEPAPQSLEVPRETIAVTRTVTLAAGLHSLQLTTDAREGVVVSLAAEGGLRPFFGPTLAPDEVTLDAVLAEPGVEPVAIEVAGPDDLLTRIVRFDVRFLAADAAVTPIVGALSVDILDERGGLVGRQTISLGNIPSPFERAILPGGQEHGVTEPSSVRLIVPPRGKTVVVRTQTRALLRAFSLLTLASAPDAFDAPYRDAVLVRTIWRYAPLDERSWVPLRLPAPIELEARLVAQVRLEPSPAELAPSADGTSIAPEGQPERQLVLERMRAGDPWQDGQGMMSGVTLNRNIAFQHHGGSPALPYWVLGPAEANLGEEVVVKVDGVDAATFRVTSTRGQWTLPPLPAGKHALEVRTDAPSLRVLLDQPGGGERYALRNVFPANRPLRVTVHKPSAAPLALDIIAYAPAAGPDPKTVFDVTIDGGAPRRLEGVLVSQITSSGKQMPLPAADRPPIVGFADTRERAGWYPRLMAVGLGDDLAPGPHQVTVTQRSGARTWVRFFALADATKPEQAFQMRRMESADE
jgi:hypothetical protein